MKKKVNVKRLVSGCSLDVPEQLHLDQENHLDIVITGCRFEPTTYEELTAAPSCCAAMQDQLVLTFQVYTNTDEDNIIKFSQSFSKEPLNILEVSKKALYYTLYLFAQNNRIIFLKDQGELYYTTEKLTWKEIW